MAQTVNDLKEIAPGVYEGTSPKKREIRRFIKLPSGLSEREMMAGLEGLFDIDLKRDPWEGTVHLGYDLTEKNEKIDGEIYMRFLADASVELLQENLQKFTDRLAEYRAEHSEGSRK